MKYISLQVGICRRTIMKIIATNNAPAAIGPYSQGIVSGSFAYCSGQIPVNPADGTIPEGIEAQAHQSCKNVAAVLAAGSTGIDKVVKTTCFWQIWQTLQPSTVFTLIISPVTRPHSCCAVRTCLRVCVVNPRQLQKYKGGQHGKLHQQTDQFRHFVAPFFFFFRTCP